MIWTQDDIGDLSGRVAVVTGANGGLGLETTKALAGAGAHVVMAARDQAKASAAEVEILAEHPKASLEIVELDLADLASVRRAADSVLAAHHSVDLLINNAGLMAMPERTTTDGFEMQFGVNHLGHWALTSHLLVPLLRAPAARVVTVTSIARLQGRPVDPDNPHLRGTYAPWKAYGQAKLANYHFGLGLQRRFERAGANAISLLAHPGLSNTGLQSHTAAEGGGGMLGVIAQPLTAVVGMSAVVGARPQLRAATDPGVSGGDMYAPLFSSNGPAFKRPVITPPGTDRAIATLWEVSERETGVALDVAAALVKAMPDD